MNTTNGHCYMLWEISIATYKIILYFWGVMQKCQNLIKCCLTIIVILQLVI